MEVFQGDHRRFWLSATAALVALALLVVLASIWGRKTPFEREQAHAESMNPMWISVEITTADNRSVYRENEPIFIIPHFSSAHLFTYKIETAEQQNFSTVDLLHISNGRQVLLNNRITCCDSRLVGLENQAYSPRIFTSLRLGPGKYEIYLTSHRVFFWDIQGKEYQPSSIQVASNLLKIRVVPDREK